MKYTVHTTVTYSTEFDSDEMRKLGITSKKKLLEYARQNYDEENVTDRSAVIYDEYKAVTRPVRKGLGSY